MKDQNKKTGAQKQRGHNGQCATGKDGSRLRGKVVTEQRKFEEEKQRREELFRAVFDQAPVGMCLVDPAGHFIQVNSALCHMLGYSENELRSMTFRDVTHPDDLADSDGWVHNLLSDKPTSMDLEKRYLHKAGHVVWGIVRANLLRDADGSPLFFSTHIQDITERKQAEESLQESQHHASLLANLLERSSQPFAIKYPDGRMGICNKAFFKMLGYPKEELLSLDWMRDLTPPEWLEREHLILENLHQTGQPVRYKKEFIRKDGVRVPVELLVHLVKNEQGRPRYYYAFATDITERSIMEARMTTLNECLLSFGVDPVENINLLVRLCGQQYSATCALYNRLHEGVLYTLGQWNTPPDFLSEDKPEGHICYDIIRSPGADVKVIRDLQNTVYAETDPNVRRYALHTYIGKAVSFGGVNVGSLCIVFQGDNPVTDKDKEFLEIAASAIGIEEMRRKAKDLLLESEKRLALSLQAGSLGVWDWDIKRNVLTWDDRMFDLYGIPKDSFAGQVEGWQNSLHPDDVGKAIEMSQAAIRGEQDYDIEFRIMHPDKSVKYIKADGLVIRDAGGNAIRMIGLNRDITGQKLMEKALMYAEKRFRALLENIRLAAVMLDLDGNITFCNDFLLALTGWSRDEVLHKNWFELFVPQESRETVKSMFYSRISKASMLKSTFPSHVENPIIMRDGSFRLLAWDNAVLQNPEGEVIGSASIGTDVTEQRKLEEQLRQSQKLEAIGQLAGGVAHDFNNILSAIVGYAQLSLMKMPQDDAVRNNLELILEASDKAATLTQSLLSFSRKQVIKPQPHNLNDIIKRLQTLLSRLIREDITITTTCWETDLVILADSGQIEQILMNLVTNARDAMPHGGHIAIRAKSARMDDEFISTHGYGKKGNYALLSVSDTGKGMDDKTKERIFEPFFTTKEQGKGTGLGLATVYGAVKQHDGYIDVYSELGKGTTFKIYLPLFKGVPGEDRNEPEPVALRGGSETILVAEDNAALRELTRHILQKYGYDVIEAVDGADAVARYIEHKERIQLIILDAIMPKKNGKIVYQEIRSITPSIKTIFVSGYAEDIIIKEGLLEPGINFLLKPITPSDLVKKVREVLDA